jgi:hypothetical protein
MTAPCLSESSAFLPNHTGSADAARHSGDLRHPPAEQDQRREARERLRLRVVHGIFQPVGMEAFARRAELELAAAGERCS